MDRICVHLYRFRDTCNVYILRRGKQAVLVDFGSGEVLDHLAAIGVDRISDVLMTHHHRDQGQGLRRAVQAGARIWVPHTEQDLFHSVDAHWQGREIYNNYNVRQDRFSLLNSVPVAGTLRDYETRPFNGFSFTVLPTPGHTPGAISLLANVDGQRLAFSGDLIAAPGKLWSLSATQWTYNGAEGVAASVAALLDLRERSLDQLLPAHGEPIPAPAPGMDLLISRLWELLQRRGQNPRLLQLRQQPYQAITPHLLQNRTSVANSYVLLSASGKALILDFGYDFVTGFPAGSDRTARRPWLYTLPALKQQFGVQKIAAVLPTHYHDDHVAGMNLLREVEGAQTWVPENFAAILENPTHYDLPCLWFDPIPVDHALALDQPIGWEEYTLRLHPLPGHTLYAVAIEFTVDGQRCLATGDQYQDDDGMKWNYVYQNRFQIGDYSSTAELYTRIRPDIILPGHWQPLRVTDQYLGQIAADADALDRLHRELLPEVPDLGAEGFLARIQPYQATARGGETIPFEVEIHNPFPDPQQAQVHVVAPPGWVAAGSDQVITLQQSACLSFRLTPPAGQPLRRARLAVDVTIGGQRFGQQAEALVTVL